MAKMTDSEILTIITNEMSNANITTNTAPSLQVPLSYYLGLPLGTEQEGRSAIVSTDVAHRMYQLIDSVCVCSV